MVGYTRKHKASLAKGIPFYAYAYPTLSVTIRSGRRSGACPPLHAHPDPDGLLVQSQLRLLSLRQIPGGKGLYAYRGVSSGHQTVTGTALYRADLTVFDERIAPRQAPTRPDRVY